MTPTNESRGNDAPGPGGSCARFELLHNGKRSCIAGINGIGVLSLIINYVKQEGEPPQYEMAATGLGKYGTNCDRHVAWTTPGIQVGDEITVRLLPPGKFDEACPQDLEL